MPSRPRCAARAGRWRARAAARTDRTAYLRRPDLGRQLDADDAQALRAPGRPQPVDLSIVDRRRPVLAGRDARMPLPLLAALRPQLPAATARFAPVVIATQARVALADEIGEAVRRPAGGDADRRAARPQFARQPGPLPHARAAPRPARRRAQLHLERAPRGLSYEAAAFKLAWLMREALRRGLTGVALKDESASAVLASEDSTPVLDKPGA